MDSPPYVGLTFPQAHCDNRVLHSPGYCEYCDRHPDEQEYRKLNNIAFTDEEDIGDKYPCPARQVRTKESLDSWAGNQPHREDFTIQEKQYYANIQSNSSLAMYGKWIEFKNWCKRKKN